MIAVILFDNEGDMVIDDYIGGPDIIGHLIPLADREFMEKAINIILELKESESLKPLES